MINREILGATENDSLPVSDAPAPARKPWATPYVIVSIAGKRTQKDLIAPTDQSSPSGYDIIIREGS